MPFPDRERADKKGGHPANETILLAKATKARGEIYLSSDVLLRAVASSAAAEP